MDIKKLGNEGLSEDQVKDLEAEVQKLTDSYVVEVDKLMEKKEKDIMTI
jgi:ribosome recycling factor